MLQKKNSTVLRFVLFGRFRSWDETRNTEIRACETEKEPIFFRYPRDLENRFARDSTAPSRNGGMCFAKQVGWTYGSTCPSQGFPIYMEVQGGNNSRLTRGNSRAALTAPLPVLADKT